MSAVGKQLLFEFLQHLDGLHRLLRQRFVKELMQRARLDVRKHRPLLDVFEVIGKEINYAMAELAKRSSFALVRQEYFFHALYLPMWWTARIAGKRNLRPGAPPSGIWRAVHRLIAWCFTVEERIIPGAVPGGSMLAVFARDLR